MLDIHKHIELRIFNIFFSFLFSLFHIGQVTIEFHVEKETNSIVLHSQDLNITEKVSANRQPHSCYKFIHSIHYFTIIGDCWPQRICIENSKSIGISTTSTVVYRIKGSFTTKNQFYIKFAMECTYDS